MEEIESPLEPQILPEPQSNSSWLQRHGWLLVTLPGIWAWVGDFVVNNMESTVLMGAVAFAIITMASYYWEAVKRSIDAKIALKEQEDEPKLKQLQSDVYELRSQVRELRTDQLHDSMILDEKISSIRMLPSGELIPAKVTPTPPMAVLINVLDNLPKPDHKVDGRPCMCGQCHTIETVQTALSKALKPIFTDTYEELVAPEPTLPNFQRIATLSREYRNVSLAATRFPQPKKDKLRKQASNISQKLNKLEANLGDWWYDQQPDGSIVFTNRVTGERRDEFGNILAETEYKYYTCEECGEWGSGEGPLHPGCAHQRQKEIDALLAISTPTFVKEIDHTGHVTTKEVVPIKTFQLNGVKSAYCQRCEKSIPMSDWITNTVHKECLPAKQPAKGGPKERLNSFVSNNNKPANIENRHAVNMCRICDNNGFILMEFERKACPACQVSAEPEVIKAVYRNRCVSCHKEAAFLSPDGNCVKCGQRMADWRASMGLCETPHCARPRKFGTKKCYECHEADERKLSENIRLYGRGRQYCQGCDAPLPGDWGGFCDSCYKTRTGKEREKSSRTCSCGTETFNSGGVCAICIDNNNRRDAFDDARPHPADECTTKGCYNRRRFGYQTCSTCNGKPVCDKCGEEICRSGMCSKCDVTKRECRDCGKSFEKGKWVYDLSDDSSGETSNKVICIDCDRETRKEIAREIGKAWCEPCDQGFFGVECEHCIDRLSGVPYNRMERVIEEDEKVEVKPLTSSCIYCPAKVPYGATMCKQCQHEASTGCKTGCVGCPGKDYEIDAPEPHTWMEQDGENPVEHVTVRDSNGDLLTDAEGNVVFSTTHKCKTKRCKMPVLNGWDYCTGCETGVKTWFRGTENTGPK